MTAIVLKGVKGPSAAVLRLLFIALSQVCIVYIERAKKTTTILSKTPISKTLLSPRPVIFSPNQCMNSGAGAVGAHHATDGVGLTWHSWFPVAL